MSRHAEALRIALASGPRPARELLDKLGISQPTLSRALAELGGDVVRIGAARSIHYLLRDTLRGLPDIAVHRVDTEGRIQCLGRLIPVRPEGFVLRQEDGVTRHSDGLPWWLFDMRPQGYLGRAYAARHGAALGLPARLNEWSDTHALRALLAHGHDMVGNLLLGDATRHQFLTQPAPVALRLSEKGEVYARLATASTEGDVPGTSAGGEQPKFAIYADTPDGARHLLVKFSEAEASPVSERWRDLLLAEHLALTTLREAGVPAATTRIFEHGTQRFLEVERFDRVGALGRRALLSLEAMDAEFVGAGAAPWPLVTQRLAALGCIRPDAAQGAMRLWAFGQLIGNTDMHNGNLSFLSEQGGPYDLAPAYDMSPMGFAPRSGGGLPAQLGEANLHPSVSHDAWRQALTLARRYAQQLDAADGLSARFQPCLMALHAHIENTATRIERLS